MEASPSNAFLADITTVNDKLKEIEGTVRHWGGPYELGKGLRWLH